MATDFPNWQNGGGGGGGAVNQVTGTTGRVVVDPTTGNVVVNVDPNLINQNLKTTDSPTFAGTTITNLMSVALSGLTTEIKALDATANKNIRLSSKGNGTAEIKGNHVNFVDDAGDTYIYTSNGASTITGNVDVTGYINATGDLSAGGYLEGCKIRTVSPSNTAIENDDTYPTVVNKTQGQLDAKQNLITTGFATQYINGFLGLSDFNTSVGSALTSTLGRIKLSVGIGGVININIDPSFVASDSQQGALSASDWATFNNKQNAITTGTTVQYLRGDLSLSTFNTDVASATIATITPVNAVTANGDTLNVIINKLQGQISGSSSSASFVDSASLSYFGAL